MQTLTVQSATEAVTMASALGAWTLPDPDDFKTLHVYRGPANARQLFAVIHVVTPLDNRVLNAAAAAEAVAIALGALGPEAPSRGQWGLPVNCVNFEHCRRPAALPDFMCHGCAKANSDRLG